MNCRRTRASLYRTRAQAQALDSAVAERVHRLEEAGIISGYHAAVDTSKIGLPITAFVRLSVISRAVNIKVMALASEMPKCSNATG
jgi:Lrp/AsnC family leucine-responsive transcriptional regulator